MGNGATRNGDDKAGATGAVGCMHAGDPDPPDAPPAMAEEGEAVPVKPQVSCSSIRGQRAIAPLSIDAETPAKAHSSSSNLANTYLTPAGGSGARATVYRVPDPESIFPGDSKILKCGGRTIAVFRIDDDTWAALDNACYHHGGPLFMGDIEDYNDQPCIVCPWHCTKISLRTGESLYEAFDVATAEAELINKQGGARQRVHEVLVRLNTEDHLSYASDRYAVLDIASNDEERVSYETIDAEASGKEKLSEQILKRKNSVKAERARRQRDKERQKNPVRVPAGQLTPRADSSKGAFVPQWVRRGDLPPDPAEFDDDEYEWSPAVDLAEEFRDLDDEYDRRKEQCDRDLAAQESQ